MKFTKMAIVGAVAGAIVTGGIGVAAASDLSVQADACGANRVCIYKHNDFVTKMGERAPGNGTINVTAVANDEMSSWKNLTNTNASWFHDAGGEGRCVTMPQARSDNDINSYDDDELSSWRTSRGC